MDKKLTPKQEKFIDAYIETGNATQAAEIAGYSKRSAGQIGGENLKKVEIQQALNERLEQLKTENVLDLQNVLEILSAVSKGEVEEEVVIQVKGGFQKIMRRSSVNNRLKAIELLCRINGWFKDKNEISLTQQLPIILRDDVKE